MRMRWSAALCAALSLAGPLAAQPSATAQVETRLRRCHPASAAVCVELVGELPQGSTPEGGAERTRSLRMGNASFVEDRNELAGGAFKPAYLLILMDVSGSMLARGGGAAAVTRFESTRTALNAFLSKLAADNLPVRVAIAPFGSERVDATIGATVFRPARQALADLARIPAPSPQANTALYSAVRAAARRIARERKTRTNVRALLLVVSDGRNDVGQDRTLLPNDSLVAATTALREAGVDPVLLGIGDNIPEAQLDSLAIGSTAPYLTTADAAGSIATKLFAIRTDLQERRVVFWTTEEVATLGRIVRDAGLSDPTRSQMTLPIAWTPPLLALPAFEFATDSSLGAAWAQGRDVDGGGMLAGRALYAGLLLLLCAAGWLIVPRWLWPPVVIERDVRRDAADVPAVSGTADSAGGLRRGVKEVAPRGPHVDTAEFPVIGV